MSGILDTIGDIGSSLIGGAESLAGFLNPWSPIISIGSTLLRATATHQAQTSQEEQYEAQQEAAEITQKAEEAATRAAVQAQIAITRAQAAADTARMQEEADIFGRMASYATQRAAAETEMAEFGAKQHEYIAGQTMAASHRVASEYARQATITASRTLAVAAASGAGAADPTVVNIISDIVGEGAYRSRMAIYGGIEGAKTEIKAAEADRRQGASASAALMAEAGIREAERAARLAEIPRIGEMAAIEVSNLERIGLAAVRPIVRVPYQGSNLPFYSTLLSGVSSFVERYG